MQMSISDGSPLSRVSEPRSVNHEDEKTNLALVLDSFKDKYSTFPKERGWMGENLYMYRGYWFTSKTAFAIETTIAMQNTFQAHSTDIYLITQPKAGTTWIKALVFATVNRFKYKTNSLLTHPLRTFNPHKCVPFVELEFLSNFPTYTNQHQPRIFGTHKPYTVLPQSIHDAGCRLVYVCRNPKDILVSWFLFANKMSDRPRVQMTLDEMFEVYTKGLMPYGPYWDHVKEHYKVSLEQPTRILFLTYEEMKRDTPNTVKRLAEFLGCPFSKEEEAKGVVEEITALCSFETLKEVNQLGNYRDGVTNESFFREGKVGGWSKYLTAEMSQTLDDITNENFKGLDISF
ncbi:hypothetical protein L2E82_29656 [Cichorium intybus]|uniref:Uncharacterized protein n=1 Tax=Cichorium intybus TaxID=13427 RepID=A0ACB9CYU0_CICIN|nr:hypothetical protein L2E82_29656 [Cichorium intybus]